jgi:hypothetical protein
MKEQSPGNGEVTWLSYNFQRQAEGGFNMTSPIAVHTLWDDVEVALREGVAPEKSTMLAELTKTARKLRKFKT